MTLKQINLSLSSACGANCIYCPSDRGKKIRQKLMPFELVERIVEEISAEDFIKYHDIRKLELGENGDAFLNKDTIKILRFIKSKAPHIQIRICSNFHNLTKDIAEMVLKENLIDVLVCNIDGSNDKNYFNVKNLDFHNTMKNLKDFLSIRDSINSEFGIKIIFISLHNYINTIYNNFGSYPSNMKDPNLIKISDDSAAIKNHLKNLLNPLKDNFSKSGIIGWAERDKIDINKINYRTYSCPNLKRIEKEAFIAPDGTWYACCLDSNNELELGNVMDTSISEIINSTKRKELIESLKKKEFSKIGGPCKTVNCCQWLPEKPEMQLYSLIRNLCFKLSQFLTIKQ